MGKSPSHIPSVQYELLTKIGAGETYRKFSGSWGDFRPDCSGFSDGGHSYTAVSSNQTAEWTGLDTTTGKRDMTTGWISAVREFLSEHVSISHRFFISSLQLNHIDISL